MAIINCPECGKKMSSRAVICLSCGFTNGEVTQEQLEVIQFRRLREKIYQISMISYAVMTVFIMGFGWYWWESGGFQYRSSSGPFIVMACAAMAYLAVRIALFSYRQKRRALQKSIKYRD